MAQQPRVRTRAVDLDDKAFKPTQAMHDEVVKYHTANVAKNGEASTERKAAKALEAMLASLSFPKIEFETKVAKDGGGLTVVDTYYGPTTTEFIDPMKLVKALGGDPLVASRPAELTGYPELAATVKAMAQVLGIAGVTKGNAEKILGTAIVAKANTSAPGGTKLVIKARK